MKTQEFQSFKELIEFDAQFTRMQQQLTQLQQEIIDQQEALHAFVDKREACSQMEKSAQKQVHTCEQEIAHIEAQEKDIKNRLEQASNHKEQQAAGREYERMGQRRHELEQELIAYWNKLESVKSECSVSMQNLSEQESSEQEKLQAKQKQLAELRIKISEYKGERDAKVKVVPEVWLEMYDAMKGRVHNPVVAVVNDGCSVCFYPVTNNDLQNLQNNTLLQCQSCYRLLYIRN